MSQSNHALSALLPVAKRFHVWLEPLLWRTLRQGYRIGLPPSWTSKSSEFLTANVRHLSVDTDYPDLGEWLAKCMGITVIHLVMDSDLCHHAAKILPKLRLRRLAIAMGDVYPLATHPTLVPLASQPTFSRLTHFEMFDYVDARMFPFLVALPALTHLAINEGDFDIRAALRGRIHPHDSSAESSPDDIRGYTVDDLYIVRHKLDPLTLLGGSIDGVNLHGSQPRWRQIVESPTVLDFQVSSPSDLLLIVTRTPSPSLPNADIVQVECYQLPTGNRIPGNLLRWISVSSWTNLTRTQTSSCGYLERPAVRSPGSSPDNDDCIYLLLTTQRVPVQTTLGPGQGQVQQH
ncbi:hypothetical protein MKEN_00204400 [Mycena kentingensis (nom. inval.)]|nr:hypothetical protein MKEN_00204400 [Mycena kentingensis (nom. inval.)]